MIERCCAFWICVTVVACATAARADEPPEPTRVAFADPESQPESPSQADMHEQLADLSRRIDNLVKFSEQQQRVAQYQLVALAAISVLLVMLLVSGSLRQRRGRSSE